MPHYHLPQILEGQETPSGADQQYPGHCDHLLPGRSHKGTEVKPNDEERVISNMTCMAEFEHKPDTHTPPLSTHSKSHTEGTRNKHIIYINPDSQSIDPHKDPTESMSRTHIPNTALDPHFKRKHQQGTDELRHCHTKG